MGEILRKAKQDLAAAHEDEELQDEEDDCVVKETDPEEIHCPRHEPVVQPSSLHLNKASNLSQHTSSTMNPQSKKSPKNSNAAGAVVLPPEPTDTLLKGAYLREQQAAQRLSQHGQNTNIDKR